MEVRSPKNQSIGFRLRIVDENNVHWAFAKEYDPSPKKELRLQYRTEALGKPLSIKTEKWTKYKIPLNMRNWTPFSYDGTVNLAPMIKVKSHKMLLANLVIIEVGFESCDTCSESNLMSGLMSSKKNGFFDIKKIGFE